MPFTFAHPGYALYLNKRYLPFLSVNGLVFGSIAPDLDILFRLSNAHFHLFTYKLQEVLLFILPFALLMSIAFHKLSRNIVIDHLPEKFQSDLQRYKNFDYIDFLKKNFAIELLSILAGIYLHIFADFLFHWNAFHVMMFFHAGIYPVKPLLPFLYYSAWYIPPLLSTLLGFWLIIKFTGMKKSHLYSLANGISGRLILFWTIFSLVALGVVLVKILVTGFDIDLWWLYLSIHLTSGLLFSVFLTPVLIQLYRMIFTRRSAYG